MSKAVKIIKKVLGLSMEQMAATSEKRSLFQKLQETYPTENLQPYGLITIVPAKAFKDEWKEKLEAEDVKIYTNNYGSQVCFFLKKTEQKPIEAKSEKKPLKIGFWTLEEETTFKELYSQGLSVKQIAERLNRSVFVVAAKVRYLKPQIRKEKPEEAKPKTKDKEVADPSSLNDDVVKEFLEASALLYPSHKTACAFLLKAASDRIMENRQSP